MTMTPKPPIHVRSFTRGLARAADLPAGDGVGTGGLAWSMVLLRTARLPVSLFRLIIPTLDGPLAARAMERAFGHGGQFEVLDDYSFALMLIAPEAGSQPMTAQVTAALRTALDEMGGRAGGAGFAIAALHLFTDEIGDPNDVLHLLRVTAPEGQNYERSSAAA